MARRMAADRKKPSAGGNLENRRPDLMVRPFGVFADFYQIYEETAMRNLGNTNNRWYSAAGMSC